MAQQVYISNHKSLYANTVTLTPDQPNQQIPAYLIPDDVGIAVKNDPVNPMGLLVRVDGKRVTSTSWPLVNGESIILRVTDASAVWVGVVGPFPTGVSQIIVDYVFEID